MKTQEDFEIFWEKTEGLTPEETQSFVSCAIPVAFPEFFLFNLPGMERAGGLSGSSFFDSSGAFTKAMIMETAGRKELETILQAYLSFKQVAESFFGGRGSRVFQPGIETRLVLFAKTFHSEFVQYLRFYEVRASLISYALIQGGGKKGILLRRIQESELYVPDRPPILEREVDEKREGPFFKEVGLDPDERRALEKIRSLPLEPNSGGSARVQGKREGGTDVLF
jgi:hypothetical protein